MKKRWKLNHKQKPLISKKRHITINPKDYENKFVTVILKNNERLVGILKKVRLLPLWKIGKKYFTKKKISKIYLLWML